MAINHFNITSIERLFIGFDSLNLRALKMVTGDHTAKFIHLLETVGGNKGTAYFCLIKSFPLQVAISMLFKEEVK